jgi:alcohol dehydrogenase (cytochrome c)
VIEACTELEVTKPAAPGPNGMSYTGFKQSNNVAVSGKAPGRIEAVDPVTGKRKWSKEFPVPRTASFLTTAGGLLFTGEPEGYVRAYDLRDGRELWAFNTGSGLRGGIVSYAVKGKQYILVPSGWGGWAGITFPQMLPELRSINGAASMIAFSLD